METKSQVIKKTNHLKQMRWRICTAAESVD